MQKYKFREYNPEYKIFFNKEKEKITKILSVKSKIEHIGSTVIPNLGGKGILDMTIGVSKTNLTKAKKELEEARYEFREAPSTSERLFFRIDYPFEKAKRRVHIHLTIYNNKDWNEMIKFRDYLLKHPETVKKYSNLKKEATEKAKGDGEKYRRYKEKFIENILKTL